jgi:formylglycine-generating enzyme required for sulfatase activity
MTHPKLFFILALFTFMNAANGTGIDIRGEITKENGEGISGAHVSLASRQSVGDLRDIRRITCLSDSIGVFSMYKSSGALVDPIVRTKNGMAVRFVGTSKGLLVRTSNCQSPMRIDIYTTDGRRIALKRFGDSFHGEIFIPLTKAISEMHMVKISTNSETRMLKTVLGLGLSCVIIPEMDRQKLPARPSQGKRSESIIDSLAVAAQGFKTVIIPLSTYIKNDIVVQLTAVHPWIPSGVLQHEGGMVKIFAKGYSFEMGQPCDTVRTPDTFDSTKTRLEQPVHTVSFTHDFWMDTSEVQQGEFDSLMRITYTDSINKCNYKGGGWSAANGKGRMVAAYSVLWGDAALFCNARSKSQGLPDTAYSYSAIIGRVGDLCTLKNVRVKMYANAFRLPTEAEWEYAYRAGTTTDYYWGKNYNDYRIGSKADIDSYAIWSNNSSNIGKGAAAYGAQQTGRKKPNNYGLYDMAGNLTEWCNDWLDYYTWGEVTDPAGPATGYLHAQRGGNWGNDATYLRATERLFGGGGDYFYFYSGFRVVKPVVE